MRKEKQYRDDILAREKIHSIEERKNQQRIYFSRLKVKKESQPNEREREKIEINPRKKGS